MFILLSLYLALAPAHAREILRPRHPSELLIGTKRDVGYRVRTARVIAFNRPEIEALFPKLAGRSDEHIERWLERQCGYVNSRQIALTGIRNTEIDYDKRDQKIFYIQPGVGRGTELEVGRVMINVKATGNTSWNDGEIERMIEQVEMGQLEYVRKIGHASGLEVFYVGAAEYLRHFLIQREFDAWTKMGATPREVVDPLFLMDLGFDVTASDQNRRAFAIGRVAHVGRATAGEWSPEIYTDHGFYQTTYSGAHLDFGGARTRYEDKESFETKAERLGPEAMREFVADELRRMELPPPARPRDSPAARVDLLLKPPSAREIVVDHRSIARMPRPEYVGDSPAMALLKHRLFRLSPKQLEDKLAKLSDEALSNLFYSARGDFKIPLPMAAYLHGFDRDLSVREFAAAAALRVLERYPDLRKPFLKIAYARLRRGVNEPSFIDEMMGRSDEFPGSAAFKKEAMAAPHGRYIQQSLAHIKGVAAKLNFRIMMDEDECEPNLSAAWAP